ncbi:MAG: CRISPR-associated endonuclease Cas2 [Kiritimatiellae bacterium]|nr:CRISPR-associated endonuclease Cas2 [Kiritimatiellia bacterium]
MKATYDSASRHCGHWILVVLDLPVKTKTGRAARKGFVDHLERRGFRPLQPSLYAKFAFTESSAKAACDAVLKNIPGKGKTAVFRVSNANFQRGFRISRGASVPLPEPQPLVDVL